MFSIGTRLGVAKITHLCSYLCLVHYPVFEVLDFPLCCAVGLIVFGEGAGDIRGGRDDDEAYGPIHIDIPIIYFQTPQNTLYVRTMLDM